MDSFAFSMRQTIARAIFALAMLSGVSVTAIPALAAPSNIVPNVLSGSSLENLAEPIALYPDVLLQVVLPAATFPDQIVDAALLIRGPEDAVKIKAQNWDPNVKTVANYPGVLKMMYSNLSWTTQLGQAFMNQNRELLDAIQRLRGKAEALGNLKSDEGQKVTQQEAANGNTYITIESSSPEVVYVPTSTTTVYEERNSSDSALVPLATFGLGMVLGAAIADDNDDHYYYGGPGGMWYGGGYDHWMDNRRAAWEDYNNRMSDRQNFNQDMRKDRQDFRQDQIEKGNWNAPTQEQRSAARQKADQRRASFQSSHPEVQSRAQTARSNYDGGAFSGYGSRSSTARASARGSYSRGSYGGGGGRRGGGRRR